MRRRLLAGAFWAVLLGFVVADLLNATEHDRFNEPPMFALGSAKAAGAGHCSGSIK